MILIVANQKTGYNARLAARLAGEAGFLGDS